MKNLTPHSQNKCKQCGTCCKKGGPVLHKQDLELITNNHLPSSTLVTIRKDEPVFMPLDNNYEPAKDELIKISGQKNSWTCLFLKPDNKCAIYDHRPLECSTLECWHIDNIANIIYRDTISRRDILTANNPILSYIDHHSQQCSFSEVIKLSTELAQTNQQKQACLDRLSTIMTSDLTIRQQAVSKFDLSLAAELFYFGRPMFKSLHFFDLLIKEQFNGIKVEQKKQR